MFAVARRQVEFSRDLLELFLSEFRPRFISALVDRPEIARGLESILGKLRRTPRDSTRPCRPVPEDIPHPLAEPIAQIG
jgi:hypothetical protein